MITKFEHIPNKLNTDTQYFHIEFIADTFTGTTYACVFDYENVTVLYLHVSVYSTTGFCDRAISKVCITHFFHRVLSTLTTNTDTIVDFCSFGPVVNESITVLLLMKNMLLRET